MISLCFIPVVDADSIYSEIGINNFVIINNHAFVDVIQTPLLLTGSSFVVWPAGLIIINYWNGNQTIMNKTVYNPTLIPFSQGATLTIKDINGTVLFTAQTYIDDIGSEWKYRFGNGVNSMVLTAIIALICSVILMLAIFYNREIVILGDKKQSDKVNTLKPSTEGEND